MFDITRARPRTRTLATLTAACALLAGCGGSDDAPTLNGATRTPPSQVGDIVLPDHGRDGKTPTDTAMKPDDGLLIAYFGYTSCPDVCPTSMADLGAALEQLSPQERDRVEVAMVTVDPQRDTADVMANYLGHFFPEVPVHAYRTTDTERLAEAEEAFGATHEIGEVSEQGTYEVSHSAQLYAVTPDGTVAVEWPFGAAPQDMAEDIQTLLARS